MPKSMRNEHLHNTARSAPYPSQGSSNGSAGRSLPEHAWAIGLNMCKENAIKNTDPRAVQQALSLCAQIERGMLMGISPATRQELGRLLTTHSLQCLPEFTPNQRKICTWVLLEHHAINKQASNVPEIFRSYISDTKKPNTLSERDIAIKIGQTLKIEVEKELL